ncbi:MAG: methyl-accepting chemotaxis protein [Gammaproteobacteria bacterium]|nr:methyl-accepting chemotaxis protein [Gammaproteobacteria bacterium]
MKLFNRKKQVKKSSSWLGNVRITQKLTGLFFALLAGFAVIGLAYYQVLVVEKETLEVSDKMESFEAGIHEVQVDLLNARGAITEFYLKKFPILLGKFDTRIISASQNLNLLTTLVKQEQRLGVVTNLGSAFEEYRNAFIKAAEAQIEIGLDENTGFNVEMIESSKQLDKLVQKHKKADLNTSLFKLKVNEQEFIRSQDDDYRRDFMSEAIRFSSMLKSAKIPAGDKSEISKIFSSYTAAFSNIASTMEILIKLQDDVKAAGKRIEPLFGTLLENSSQIVADARSSSAKQKNQITIFFLAVLIFTSIAVSVALFMLGRSITVPIRQLRATVMKVNEGDMSARAQLTQKDELGELATAFDKLLDERVATLSDAEKESEQLNDSVIALIRAVSKLAQDKDLAVKIPVSEDITGAISDSLNLLAKETASIMGVVKSTSNQVANVSYAVKRQSDHVIAVANQERKEVQVTNDLLKDSVSAMNMIAKDAQEANDKATLAIENTKRAAASVLSSVDGINTIRNTISETEKRIKRLGERSQEISGIVNLINSIAERTHILALNASMHAASAGEAGRGFAVVAEEVQRLAENARDATLEISTVVNNIRVETADTVTTMNSAISQVAEGTRLAEQAGQSMRDTQQATTELVRAVQQIASSSLNQAEISKQLLKRGQIIQESTEQTSRELIEQTKNTEELVRHSGNLVSSVAVFKLPGDAEKKTTEDDMETVAFESADSIREAG